MIELPWPPATLSGHNNGNRWEKSPIVKKHREWARDAAQALGFAPPEKGDIPISVVFYPPDNRSDRINYWNRCKPYFDGLAEGMGVNDKRFVPAGYYIREVVKGGKVVIYI
jgi:hypothetical protein